jgi:hypothetical protein
MSVLLPIMKLTCLLAGNSYFGKTVKKCVTLPNTRLVQVFHIFLNFLFFKKGWYPIPGLKICNGAVGAVAVDGHHLYVAGSFNVTENGTLPYGSIAMYDDLSSMAFWVVVLGTNIEYYVNYRNVVGNGRRNLCRM